MLPAAGSGLSLGVLTLPGPHAHRGAASLPRRRWLALPSSYCKIKLLWGVVLGGAACPNQPSSEGALPLGMGSGTLVQHCRGLGARATAGRRDLRNRDVALRSRGTSSPSLRGRRGRCKLAWHLSEAAQERGSRGDPPPRCVALEGARTSEAAPLQPGQLRVAFPRSDSDV